MAKWQTSYLLNNRILALLCERVSMPTQHHSATSMTEDSICTLGLVFEYFFVHLLIKLRARIKCEIL